MNELIIGLSTAVIFASFQYRAVSPALTFTSWCIWPAAIFEPPKRQSTYILVVLWRMLFWLVDFLILWNRSKYRHCIRKWWMAKWIRYHQLYRKTVGILSSKFWPQIRTSDQLLTKSSNTNGSRNLLITSMYFSTYALPGDPTLKPCLVIWLVWTNELSKTKNLEHSIQMSYGY